MSAPNGDSDIQDWDERPISPMNYTTGASSSADLKSQLSQLQHKLNLSTLRPVRQAPNVEPEIHLPPMMPISASTNNGTNSTSSSPVRTISTNRTSDKSIDFLGDLSDGLLIESRKLSYENRQYKKQITILVDENDSMRKQISNYKLLNDQLSEKEEESTDKIWNLETEVGNFKKSLEKTKSDLQKVTNDNSASIKLIEELKNSIEVLKSEKQSLLEGTNSTISKLNSQLDELKESNENLNDENDILHKNILSLKSELEVAKTTNYNENNDRAINETSFSEFDDSIIQDPVPLNLSDEEVSKLDNDTLKKNLNLSYRHILKLKSQNSKIKSELLKLKHKSPSKSSIKSNELLENSWGNFDDDSFVKQSNSPLTTPTLINSDDDENEENDQNDATDSFFADVSQLDRSSPSSSRKPSISKKQKESYLLIVPKTTLESVPTLDLKKIDLTEFQTIPISNSIAYKLFETSSATEKNKYFNDTSLQLVPATELTNLQSSLENPSIDYIKSKSESHDHVFIPVDEHKQLLSTIDESNKKLSDLEKSHQEKFDALSNAENNLKTTSEELGTLKVVHENPSIDYIKSKAESHNHVIIPSDEHNELLLSIDESNKKLADLEKFHKEKSEVLTQTKNQLESTTKELDSLKSEHENPSIDYIKSKSSAHDHISIPVEEHNQLKSSLDTTKHDLDELKKSHQEKLDAFLKLENELKEKSAAYDSLKSEHENPSIAYIKSKSEANNHISLPVDEHQKLLASVEESNKKITDLENVHNDQTETINKVQSQLQETSSQLDSKSKELASLKTQHDSPSVDYIKSKLPSFNLVALDSTAHENIKQRIEKLQDRIHESNSHLETLKRTIENLKTEKHQLEEQIRSPELDYLKEKSTLLHFVMVPEADHIEMESKLTVLQAQLNDKANEVNALSESKSQLEAQIVEFKKEIADLKSTTFNYESKLKSLQDSHDSPDVDYIKSKSTAHGLIVLPIDEHDKLKQENSDYSEKVAELSGKLDSINDEHSKLLSTVQERDAQLSSFQTEIDSHKKTLADLHEKVENPDAEYIKSKASLHQLTAIPMAVHDSLHQELKSKDEQLAEYSKVKEELAAKHAELEQLHSTKDDLTKSIEEAADNLKAREIELEKLKQDLQSPSFDYIKEKSDSHGWTTLTKEELDALNNELTENSKALAKKEKELKALHKVKADLERQARDTGAKTVSLDMHESVQNDLHQTKQELDEHKKEIENLIKLKSILAEKEQELSTLVEQANELEGKAAKFDEVNFELEALKNVQDDLNAKHKELEDMQAEKVDMQEKINSLEGKEIQLSQTLEDLESKNSELKSLQASFEKPNISYIEEKSKSLGYVPITLEEHNLSKSNLAELEEGRKKNSALEEQLVLLSTKNNELAELNESLEKSVAELAETKKLLQNPNVEYIKEKSAALGYIPLSVSEHERLKGRVSTLESELDGLNSKIAAVEVEKSELNDKIKELETANSSPSLEYIQSKSASLGIIPIPIIEHTSMKSELQRKDIILKENKQQLEELDSLKKDVADKESQLKETNNKLDDLTSAHESPSFDYLSEKLSNHGHVAIPKGDLEELYQSNKQREEESEKLKKDLSEKHVNFEKLVTEHESPSLEYLKDKLASHNHVAVEQNELKKQNDELDALKKDVTEKNKQLDDLNLSHATPSIEYLKDKLASHNHVAIEQNELKKQTDELDALKKDVTDKNIQLEDLHSTYTTPSIDYLKDKVASHNHVLVHKDDFDDLHTLNEKQSKEVNELKNEVSVKDKQLEELSSSHAAPSIDYLKEKVTSHDHVVVHKEDYDNIQAINKKQLEELEKMKNDISTKKAELDTLTASYEAPSIDYLKEKLGSRGHVAVTDDEFKQLQEVNNQQLKELETLRADISDKKAQLKDTMEKLNEMSTSYESPSVDYLKEKLGLLNYVAISNEEISDLQGKNADSIEVIKELKNKLQSADAKLDEKDKQLEQLSVQLESVKRDYENAATTISSGISSSSPKSVKSKILPDDIDEARLHDIAAAKGMTLLSVGDLQRGMDMKKSSSVATVTSSNVNDLTSQSIDTIIAYLEPRGYTVITNEEYENILKNGSEDELENLADITHEMEDIESDLESKKHMLEELDSISRRQSVTSTTSSVRSSVSVSVENILTTKYDRLHESIGDITKEIVKLREQKDTVNKQVNRLSVSAGDVSSVQLSGKLSKKISNINNKIEAKEIELKSQQSALAAVHAYLEKSKGMNLPPVTSMISDNSPPPPQTPERIELQKEISTLQSKYDEKKQEMDKLTQDLNSSSEPSQLAEKLSLLGYSVVSPSGKQYTIKEVSLHGIRIPITAVTHSESFDVETGIFTVDTLATTHGYSIVAANETENKLLDIQEISLDDLKARADELEQTVISNQKFNLIFAKSKEPKLPDSFTFEELDKYAKKLDLRVISNDDIKRLKERTITSRELASKAAELNLTLLTPTEVEELKMHEPVSKENIQEKSKEFDLLCIPKSQFVATTVSRTPDIPNVTVVPNTYYKILTKSHEWYKKNKNKLSTPTPPPQSPRSPTSLISSIAAAGNNGGTNVNQLAIQAPSQQQQLRDNTIPENDSFEFSSIMPKAVSGGAGVASAGFHMPANMDTVSLHTVDTVISNKKVIIAAIAKTIMGDYFYKYYRKLGPLSSVSDTRHERYFWIHPYSMTLYWSAMNPTVSDPAKNHIKALSILNVDVVDDNNPLPPGLYHKSIIIKSHDKNIKLTCPTRQLHNVWFNSLKYLLERTTDSWVNDDDLEDQYQQDFTLDSKTKMERSHSQMLRRGRLSHAPSMTSTRLQQAPVQGTIGENSRVSSRSYSSFRSASGRK